jgi:cephalosporin hydroxylase
MTSFSRERDERITENGRNEELRASASALMKASIACKYSYNFCWLGRPIIQYPQDIVGLQEIIWLTKPDLIIETGIAHGGSLIFSASMLELNAICGGPSDAKVLGIDIDIRSHNRSAIENHRMISRIEMIQGSSVAPDVIKEVRTKATGKKSVMVCLDSNHTHNHVLAELEAYALLTSVGNYCVVFDTIIQDIPADMIVDRPWGPGNNPKTAVREYLKTHPEFEIDRDMDNKLMVSVARDGFLRRKPRP